MVIRKFYKPLLILNISTIFVLLKAVWGKMNKWGGITMVITVLIYCD